MSYGPLYIGTFLPCIIFRGRGHSWGHSVLQTQFLVDSMRATMALEPDSVAQLDAPSNWRPGGRGFNPR